MNSICLNFGIRSLFAQIYEHIFQNQIAAEQAQGILNLSKVSPVWQQMATTGWLAYNSRPPGMMANSIIADPWPPKDKPQRLHDFIKRFRVS